MIRFPKESHESLQSVWYFHEVKTGIISDQTRSFRMGSRTKKVAIGSNIIGSRHGRDLITAFNTCTDSHSFFPFSSWKKEDMVCRVSLEETRNPVHNQIVLLHLFEEQKRKRQNRLLDLECQSSPFFSLSIPIHSLPSPTPSMRGDGKEAGESKEKRVDCSLIESKEG